MLVGRTAERRRLSGLLAGARIGTSGVLVLLGEAGIGKTALLDEVAAEAYGLRVLRATGTEAEREVPFGALGQLLRPTEADLARLPQPQADALGVALALRSGRAGDRFTVGAATLSLLVRYSEDRPIALLVDDAHLLDGPSGDALAFAVRRLLADPVAVLVAARAGEPCALASPDLPRLLLGGLDLPAVQELVAERTRAPVAPDLAARLLQTTGGNPLAVLELSAAADRVLAQAPGAPGPLPAALADHFVQRVVVLPAVVRAALLLVAVAGGDVPIVQRAAQALGLDLAAALAGAEAAGLIRVEPQVIEYVHPLVRAAAYAAADPAERRRVHALVATCLPAGAQDRRAWHRSEAAFLPDEAVAADMAAVGQRASDRGGHAVAATATERAARLTPDDAERAHRFLAAARAAWAAGDSGRALALLEEALTWDQTPAHSAQVLGLHGEIEARSGSLRKARRVFLDAAEQVTASDPDTALLLLSQAVTACFYLGDAAGALDAAGRASLLLAGGRGRPAEVVGTMAVGVARVLAGQGGLPEIRRAVQAVAGADGADRWPDDPVHSIWLVVGPLFLREAGTGRALVRDAVDRERTRAAVGSLPRLLFYIARDGATTEQWARAETDYAEAIGLARELGQTTDLAMSLAGLAWLQARVGRFAASAAHAEQALALANDRQVHLATAWARWALGDAALAAGRTADAAAAYGALAAWLADRGMLDVDLSPAPELAEALLMLGDHDGARTVVAGYTARAQAKGQPWARARAARLAGLLAADLDLDEAFGVALDLHERTVDTYEQARTQLAYGARLRRARRRTDARPPLRAALKAFDALGARPWADTAAGELRATGEPAVARGSGGSDELTSRERQIAVLLAQGRTTREAASALFLSPKTVEYHLRHAYTKLGISTRAELAALVAPEL